jgi:hypothetical protein
MTSKEFPMTSKDLPMTSKEFPMTSKEFPTTSKEFPTTSANHCYELEQVNTSSPTVRNISDEYSVISN